ncbi:MAG TPA: glycosyl transferase [Deltaproteobacteria bacterium]|nr:glycosyl transferase [Deltaproteobacteria bacterium]HOM29844.1 glycosyl transferase [Deltaproteobacteria bacterium]
MADFYQHPMIATLQRLKDRPIGNMESELELISLKRKMVLLLPALVSEFDTPSMPRIIDELTQVNYLSKIVLSLDRADWDQFETVKKKLSLLPAEVKVVWHDGPRLQGLYDELRKNDFRLEVPGKGRSVWMTVGYILADRDVDAIALHDCDIMNYSREIVARLFYPIVHPALDYEFSKGYYARVTDRLYGRVTRLFYLPLITTLKKILRTNTFLEYLGSFRYALAGEFAMISSLARGIRISPTWGLEISLLNEVYQRTAPERICQVEIAETYEHKHQGLEKDKPDSGLIRMATDIAEALFRILSQDGVVLSQSFFRTMFTTYMEESRMAIEKNNALSLINGLTYDRHSEIEASEAFVESLKTATANFVSDPVGIPMMSAWTRISAAIPDFQERLYHAVEEDNRM